jgi:hypothetical protein
VAFLLSDPRSGESALRNVLREAWAGNGWWREIDVAIEAHRRGALVFVGKGVQMKDLIDERLRRDPPQGREAMQARLNQLNEEWNQAYHADLEGLRPSDIADWGPEETQLMQEFGTVVSERLPKTDQEADTGFQLKYGILQQEWLMTPQEKLGGRCPFAVIWTEKRQRSRNPAYDRHYLDMKLNEMCFSATEGLKVGERHDARLLLEAILQVEPGHPLARRLLVRIT